MRTRWSFCVVDVKAGGELEWMKLVKARSRRGKREGRDSVTCF